MHLVCRTNKLTKRKDNKAATKEKKREEFFTLSDRYRSRCLKSI